MAALPPNWARYTTEDGKEYFHNSVTNLTQWDMPEFSGGLGPDTLSFHSGTSEVYQYKPGDSDLEMQPPDGDGKTVAMESQPLASVEPFGKAPGGKVPTSEGETVSLHNAPSGVIGSGPSAGTGRGGGGGFAGFGSSGFVGSVLSVASSEDGAAVSGLFGPLLAYAQQLFDVSSDDVVKRLRLSLMPYPPPPGGASNDFRVRPDFYGPFWVATTAMLFLAATGNFARMLVTDHSNDFKADYGLVRLSAGMIYGLLAGVPVVTRVALYCSGHDVESINFRQMICVYGYSLTPTIPVSILCLVPWEGIRWLAVLLGLAASLAFIREHLLTDIGVEAPSLKWKMGALFGAAQAAIFIVYRVHFFNSTP